MNLPFDAVDALQALATGQSRSADLTELCIARILRWDRDINALAVRDFDRAREVAAAADRALAAGKRLPLLGLPITLKESIQTAGLHTTVGLESLRQYLPTADAPVVRRLRAAGAVLLGKTNLAEGLNDWQCRNPIYGVTNNPWDLSRTPGGSSGGSAAAVAAGFSCLDIGSDVAGSITIPAHFSGVFGHRPSVGIVPGVATGMPGQLAPSDLAAVGPLARSSRDLSLALDVITGPIQPEATAWQLQLPVSPKRTLRDFRVLVLTTHPLVPTANGVLGPLQQLTERLQEAGCTILDRHAGLPDLAEATRLYVRLLLSTRLRYADASQRHGAHAEALAWGEGTSLQAVAAHAAIAAHYQWVQWNEQRAQLRRQWQELFRDVDVVLCPPSPILAFCHDGTDPAHRVLQLDGGTIPYFDQLAWVSLAIAAGLPVTTVPIERDPQRLPCGVQIVGAYLHDRTTLAFAAAMEDMLGPALVPPLEGNAVFSPA